MRSTVIDRSFSLEESPLDCEGQTTLWMGERGLSDIAVARDGHLADAVARALRATGYPALRDIQIDSLRGKVTLWGHVPSYFQKQLAQATAQRVAGAGGISNEIEVICGRSSRSEGN
jgi:osmotically-inducible protein OsmY